MLKENIILNENEIMRKFLLSPKSQERKSIRSRLSNQEIVTVNQVFQGIVIIENQASHQTFGQTALTAQALLLKKRRNKDVILETILLNKLAEPLAELPGIFAFILHVQGNHRRDTPFFSGLD